LVSIFALLGVISVYAHSYQGLYNFNTEKWNSNLKPGGNKDYLFSWAEPQFLAKPGNIELETFTAIYRLGDDIYPESENAFFEGWHPREQSDFGSFFRPTKKKARIWVNINGDSLPAEETLLALDLTVAAVQPQTVEVFISGHKIGTIKSDENPAGRMISRLPILPQLISVDD
jgi:hypothetical protein